MMIVSVATIVILSFIPTPRQDYYEEIQDYNDEVMESAEQRQEYIDALEQTQQAVLKENRRRDSIAIVNNNKMAMRAKSKDVNKDALFKSKSNEESIIMEEEMAGNQGNQGQEPAMPEAIEMPKPPEPLVIQIIEAPKPFNWKELISWLIGGVNGMVLLVMNIKNLKKK